MRNDFVTMALLVGAAAVVIYYLNQGSKGAIFNQGAAAVNYVAQAPKKLSAEVGNVVSRVGGKVANVIPGRPVTGNGAHLSEAQLSSATPGCFTREELTTKDLLPKDDTTQWANLNPEVNGYLRDKNFLHAGYHWGIDTQASTLKNANLQVRSEPSNPQVVVSPWLNSSYEPDVYRRPLEIGADY